MQSIAVDTILQQRYRILKSIGEGAFGRTYLASDQSRFGEQCAVKELCMSTGSRSRLSKAREFFQQEAALLYQLQHPQIPRFWATFEERDRMFLVQDFIPGRTYEQLLSDRANYGQAFTEAEVWRFLLQVLPVLGYIHSQGVVHQDIAPDNIILRENDFLPVLIDFGVVKQLANRLQGEQNSSSNINVGKPGYAPVEQLGSGYAYPNSDLYALAVTAVVLLTGRPAVDLFEGEKINWSWRNWIPISDGLANVLGKMLSYQPLDRYQSSVEVFQALQSISIPTDRPDHFKPITVSKIHGTPAATSLYDEESRPPTTIDRVYTALTKFDVKSTWEKPQVVIPLFLGVATLSFATSMVLSSTLVKLPETPVVSAPVAQQPLVSPRSGDSVSNKSIDLVAGQTVIQKGRVMTKQEVIYDFYGTQGQELTLSIDNRDLLLTVLNAASSPIDANAIRTPSWRGRILTTGKHSIIIKPSPIAQGEGFSYRMSASLVINAGAPPVTFPSATTPSSIVVTPTPDSNRPLPPVPNNPISDIPNAAPINSNPRPVPIIIPSSQPRALEQDIQPPPIEKPFEIPSPKPDKQAIESPQAEPSTTSSPVETSPTPAP